MLRVYLSGQLTLEAPEGRVETRLFPGQQGREAFTFLAMRAGMPVSRHALLDALWRQDQPASAEASLNSIISKLRRLLGAVGLRGAQALRFSGGSFELHLPADTWVDHLVAFDAIHQAETALRRGDARAAYGPSAIARQICGRPFLPGSEADWIENRRVKLRRTLVRALECRSRVYLMNGEHELAVEVAREAATLEPLRESSYRLLMEAHAQAGNSAEALRVYEQCRAVIADALGVPPSERTKQVQRRIMGEL
jgi:DNA-binding SARP family transcriptional activator